LFLFQDDFEDKDRRQRQWFTVAEAERILVPHKPNHLRYLAAFTATKSTVGDGKRCQVSEINSNQSYYCNVRYLN
jgi:hypothetical protein